MCLALRRANEILDVVEVDAGKIGTEVRHGLFTKDSKRLEAHGQHPFRLILEFRNFTDGVFREAAFSNGSCVVFIVPTEFVVAKTL